jgi:CBS domain-containing protein/sporulation protein YlmC with PRC-barrel domain
MPSNSTFYLSAVIGNKILCEGDGSIGRVRDLVVDVGQSRPRVVAVLVRSGGGERLVDFGPCRLARSGGRVLVVAKRAADADLPGVNLLYLKKHLLDRQIVDMDGRKLVRVNDLVIDAGPSGSFLVAVDVGIEGLVRRLGVERPLNAFLGLFRKALPTKLILWNEVETVDFQSMEIKLSKPYSKLDTFHPSDLADILEDLDKKSQLALFQSLDEERAADVMEELEPQAQVGLLEGLEEAKAADVLEKMPADEVADILDELKQEKAERLLAEMEKESQAEVRDLMRYPDNTVGSLMSTDYLFFSQSVTVGDALAEFRRIKPEADTVYYVYVLDGRGRYVATVSLRDIVVSEPETRLKDIMSSDVDPLKDSDDLQSIADLLLKYKLHAVPVVNEESKMVGSIVIEDVLENVMRKRK